MEDHGKTIAINWNWGAQTQLAFDPAHDMLDFGWMGASNITIAEVGGSVVIGVVGNNQSYTLTGVTLDQLGMDNIIAKDASTLAAWEALVDDGDHHPPMEMVDTLKIEWHWGEDKTVMFDPEHGKIDLGWFQAKDFVLTQMDGMAMIDVVGNDQMYMLHGTTLADLDLDNFIALDYDSLVYIAKVLGEEPPERPITVVTPGGGGGSERETISWADPDGAGKVYSIFTNGTDITDFDPAHDRLDFGGHSVHAFIIVDTPEGVGFRSPWNSDILIVKGVRLADLDIDNFTAIGNQHLREDVSGALAWEHGIVAQPHTVYARSHEVGQVDRVEFDPATDKVDFRYYGSRELLTMTQSSEGTVIADGATGQKLILLGVDKSELTGANFIFHMSQVDEDHLDTDKLGITHLRENVLPRTGIPTAGSAASELPDHQHAPVAPVWADGGDDQVGAGDAPTWDYAPATVETVAEPDWAWA